MPALVCGSPEDLHHIMPDAQAIRCRRRSARRPGHRPLRVDADDLPARLRRGPRHRLPAGSAERSHPRRCRPAGSRGSVPQGRVLAAVRRRRRCARQFPRSSRRPLARRLGRPRPAAASVSIRRATATIARGPFTIDAGKQFIRWGKTDIVTPTDRFAPRDFLNVVDTEFLAVSGVRAVVQAGEQNTFEVVWVPRLTPSRLPLFDQRWTVVPRDAPQFQIVDAGAVFPSGPQTGIRWSRIGTRIEHALSFFDGFNHLPNVDVRAGPFPTVEVSTFHPPIRSYGADAAIPLRWFTVKGEAAYVTSSSPAADEYVIYVVQVERQTGEWVFAAGYAGEAVTERRAGLTFAPDRGLTKSIVGRASYTIGPNRSVAFETAIRQNLNGVYGRAEYSQAHGQHWRVTRRRRADRRRAGRLSRAVPPQLARVAGRFAIVSERWRRTADMTHVVSFTPILLDAHNPGPMTGRGNNTYFLPGGPAGAALIDAGVGDWRHLEQIDRELQLRKAHLACVLVTHGHTDHASGVAADRRAASRSPRSPSFPGRRRTSATRWHGSRSPTARRLSPAEKR